MEKKPIYKSEKLEDWVVPLERTLLHLICRYFHKMQNIN